MNSPERGASVEQDRIAGIDADSSMRRRVVLENPTHIRCKIGAIEVPHAGARLAEDTKSIQPQAALEADQCARLVRIARHFRVHRGGPREIQQQPAAEGALRILADFAVGEEQTDIPLRVEIEALDKALEKITEPNDLYAKDHVLPPSHAIKLSHQVRPVVLKKVKSSVGLFGALEVRHVKGPLFAGRDYVGRTKILKLTESPKAEAAWYDVFITDAKTGEEVAVVRYMLRFMKASSPLWTEAA